MSKSLFERTRFKWDAMLKMKKIKLDIFTDADIYTFFEKGTRGGISYIPNRYSKHCTTNKVFH